MSGPSSPDPVSPYILLGMTATTGIVDAVSLLALGHVFTANMTGNVVFLGFALAGAPGFSIPRSSMALMAFLLGAAAGGRLATRMSSRPAPYWTSRAFCIDGLLLISAALASLTLRSPVDKDLHSSFWSYRAYSPCHGIQERHDAQARRTRSNHNGLNPNDYGVGGGFIFGRGNQSAVAEAHCLRAADVFGGCRG
jgi:hypothetical protein